MSKGPGHVMRTVIAAAETGQRLQVEEVCRVAYPNAATVEEKHRVAVRRAIRTVARRRPDLSIRLHSPIVPGWKVSAQARKTKTHCKRGHPLSGSNLLSRSRQRECRECHKIHMAAYRQRRKGRERRYRKHELLTALMLCLRVSSDKASTFKARVDSLQRIGFVRLPTGRGNHADYTIDQAFDLLVAFDLMDLGLPQETAINAAPNIIMGDQPLGRLDSLRSSSQRGAIRFIEINYERGQRWNDLHAALDFDR